MQFLQRKPLCECLIVLVDVLDMCCFPCRFNSSVCFIENIRVFCIFNSSVLLKLCAAFPVDLIILFCLLKTCTASPVELVVIFDLLKVCAVSL